jgi:predicted alpha/beta-fold hydrolase
MKYRVPWWLPGGHLQTIWPALYGRSKHAKTPTGAAAYRRERWPTPDGDCIDVDWLDAPRADTLLVLFHGLEGSSASHYAKAFAGYAKQRGFSYAVPHFRGCSGEINLAPRAYHAGDYEEIGWVLDGFRQKHRGAIIAVGVSLGGNALLRWAEEAGKSAKRQVNALASVSAPVDLAASGLAISQGFGRYAYGRMFLASMKSKALRKLAQYPELFEARDLRSAQDLHAFDNVFTAPLHGFKNTEYYWARASAGPRLASIEVPTLLVNALNDPFLPSHSLPGPDAVGRHVTLWQPRQGGHVGFPARAPPGHLRALPEYVGAWLSTLHNA